MAVTDIPAEMKALICDEVGQPLQLRVVPTPEAIPGSCVVHVLAVVADPHTPRILSGKAGFTFPKNFCPASKAIGRVAATGIDTTSLEVGQLVMLEPFVRARDDPNVQILWGVFDGPSPASKKFMADNWTMAAFAEYVRAPLENCYALNEKILCGDPTAGGLGYSPYDLLQLHHHLVAFGGLRAIDLKVGETVIVAPATGVYSGAAVQVAVAMGAKVIAMSRNIEALRKLQNTFPKGRVNIVQSTGDVEKDSAALKEWGPIDAYIDVSPAQVKSSTHVRSCFLALRQYARVALMGVISDDLAMPYALAVWNNLTIKGQYMYEREDVRLLIRMAESGALKLGKDGGNEIVGTFKLEEIEEAFEVAGKNAGAGKLCLVTP